MSWHLIFISARIRSYSWVRLLGPLEVKEAFLYEFIVNLPNVVCTFRWSRNQYKPNNLLNPFQLHLTIGKMKQRQRASKYLEDTISVSSKPPWAKRLSVCIMLLSSRGISVSVVSSHWYLLVDLLFWWFGREEREINKIIQRKSSDTHGKECWNQRRQDA